MVQSRQVLHGLVPSIHGLNRAPVAEPPVQTIQAVLGALCKMQEICSWNFVYVYRASLAVAKTDTRHMPTLGNSTKA